VLLGIMTRVFQRATLEEVADAVRALDLPAVQLNLLSAGLAPMPERLEPGAARRIGDVFRGRGLEVAALSANFNAIHPDRRVREEGIRRFALLASRSQLLGTSILTMCTGTRDRNNMWRRHPNNRTKSAWQDLLATARQLAKIAGDYGATVAFEPEIANVIDCSEKAERLIEEIGARHFRLLLDGANLLQPGHLPDTRPVLEDAFVRLGPYIVLAHAKDVLPPQPASVECRRVAPGHGILDFPFYLHGLAKSGFKGAIVMHDLAENQVERCRNMLQKLAAVEVG
jgi:sugar phosphate isomerase/epimerase